MGDRILDKPAGKVELLLIRSFGAENPLFVLFWLLNIKRDPKLPKTGEIQLAEDKEKDRGKSISEGSHFTGAI